MTGTFTGGAGARAQLVASSIDYGDGSDPTMTSGAPGSISHTYPRPGKYTVTVDVSDDHGGDDQETQSVAITASTPRAILTSTQNSVGGTFEGIAGNDDISFQTGMSVPATGQTISSLSLDPGDSSGSHDVTTYGYYSASYTASGSYHASLTLDQTSSTLTSTETAPVYIAADTGSASLTGPSTAAVGSPVSLTLSQAPSTAPSGSGVPADTITSRILDFGDGTSAVPTSTTASHTFTTPGAYYVDYYAYDSYGGSYEAQAKIVVTAPTPTILYSSLGGDNGQLSPWVGVPAGSNLDVNVAGLGSTGHSSGATYRIDYGDGSAPATGTLNSDGDPVDGMGNLLYLSHTYATPGGEYTATTTVTDTAGLTTSVSQHVSVAGQTSFTLGTATRSAPRSPSR